MTIVELIERLDALWPFGGVEALNSATESYRAILGNFEGARLAKAWAETLAEWKDRNRPLPAAIRAHMPSTYNGPTASGPNQRERFEAAKARAPKIVEEWHFANADWLNSFSAEFEDGEHVRDIVRVIIRDRAWIAAQDETDGKSATIILSHGDLQMIRGRYASQRSHAKKAAALPDAKSRLAPLHVPMKLDEAPLPPLAESGQDHHVAANDADDDGPRF